jgi:hypothetical protein
VARSTSAPPKAAVERGGQPWIPQPQQIRHRRTFGDVLRGFGAFLVLAALLGAIPFALVRYIGWPLPHRMPSAAAFNEPITQETLLHALAVIVWLAWVQFAACVLVELVAAARGVGMPTKVPGAAPSQFLARQLVATLLMVTASAASFVPSLAHLGDTSQHTAKAPTSVSASAHPGSRRSDSPAVGAATVRGLPGATSAIGNQAPSKQVAVRAASDITMLAGNSAGNSGIKLYRVMPPAGRHHDSLWDIALRHLGDGRRYKEIFNLNKDRVQPDGSMLTEASLIRPGWILAMPADATGGDLISSAGTQAIAPSAGGSAQDLTLQGPSIQDSAARILPTPISPAAMRMNPITPIIPTISAPASTPWVPGKADVASGDGVGSAGADTSTGAVSTDVVLANAEPTNAELVVAEPAISESANDVATDDVSSASDTSPDTASSDSLPPDPLPANAASSPDEDTVAPIPVPVTDAVDEQQAAPETAEINTVTAEQDQEVAAVDLQAAPTSEPQVEPKADPPADAEQQAVTTPGVTTTVTSTATTATVTTATTTTAGRDSGRASSHRGQSSSEESQAPATESRVLYGLAGAPLLAAGLLLALGRHRRRQLWHRIFGRRPIVATGDGAVAEESIRLGAGEVEVWFLDLALRGLSDGLAGLGGSVPGAYALKLREQGIELMLTKPTAATDPNRPSAPWYVAADGRSWNLNRSRIGEIDVDGARRRFAPYPGMVTLGSVGPDRILVDLEEARGIIAIDGPRDLRRAALAALAVELSTNSWSDRMTVTLIGFPGDLTVLAPARIRHAQTLEEVLPALEIEAAERHKALTAAGLDSVLGGRSRATHATSFTPHFVLVAEEPHPVILARLAQVATGAARVGMGFVVAGAAPGATWQLTLHPDGRIQAPVLGIEAEAQLLPEDQYAAVLGLFRAVCDVQGSQTAPAQVHQSVGYKGSLPDEPPAVYVRLLGPLGISGAGVIEPERAPIVHEALVFLLHHRDGVHPRVLAAALWPRGTTADVAQAAIDQLGGWLGTDQHGEPNLRTDPDGRLRLGPSVWSDWDVFQSFQSQALYDASIVDPAEHNRLLGVALDLVRGPYLAERVTGRYGWLAYEVAEAQVPALIADTALQLAEGLIAAGQPQDAIRAIKTGILGSPDDEELWRGLLRSIAATDDTARLEEAVQELYKRTWYIHGVKGLHPRTEALVDELLPDWRGLLAA